ncbi:hypothetical protein Goarm_013246 [Gossypium armourianum]|uniref:CCHC-type domain-containing protein n=1 Tax=Gossypium armourianum TaxID=34283 RepID=A0A7J9J574_9ROSI|nr:hypothetical protein [Gossypium armourianum]
MEGKFHIVEYENMPNVCYDCGYFGHMNEGCPKIQLEKKKEMGDDRNVDQNKAQELKQPSLVKLVRKSELKAFGAWILISRNPRSYCKFHFEVDTNLVQLDNKRNSGSLMLRKSVDKGKLVRLVKEPFIVVIEERSEVQDEPE